MCSSLPQSAQRRFSGFRAALDRFFFKNAEYTLRRISFNLDGILTREEALAATGLREGCQYLHR